MKLSAESLVMLMEAAAGKSVETREVDGDGAVRKAGTRFADVANHTSTGGPSAAGRRSEPATARRPGSPNDAAPLELIERVVERENMTRAYKRVVGNRGAPGIDGMTLDDLKPYLDVHWSVIKRHLLAGTYRPKPTRRVEIPKASGGKRQLGIPTVVDRLIGQALAQVLTPIFDPTFSERSYGYRPKKSAHEAVLQAREHVASGKRWVVDLDLARFFDEVNHDKLMARLASRIEDKRVLRLLRRFLQAGVLTGGLVSPREKGTPQGSPLSPLLSNVVLDELDKELERRGNRFCRFADDLAIYVGSRKAGERVLASVTRWIEGRLKLKVNRTKSTVDRPWRRSFLGYSFTNHKETRLRVPADRVARLRAKLKELFRRARGRNVERLITEELNPVLRGWIIYFRLSQTKGFAEELDGWVRRRLRLIVWKQWKRPRTRQKRMLAAGLSRERASRAAFNGHGPWWNSGASHMHAAFPERHFDRLGLVSTLAMLRTRRHR